MKLGENPQRGEARAAFTVARVFLVVYVPHLTGFFAHMQKILDWSLDSLERTASSETCRVTLISNASCDAVEKQLMDRQSVLFDQVILDKQNRGKIDGLLSVARGALEEVVVLSDCDVLFRKGWLEAILNVFAGFPEAGSVSPIASPRRYSYETRTTLLSAALKRELVIKKRQPMSDFRRMTDGSSDPEAQLRFLGGQATVTRNGIDAGIAGGHQCVAFRNEMLRKLPTRPCLRLLEPHADRDFLDRPPDVHGYWRLSTPRNYAYHMGNTPARWMTEPDTDEEVLPLPALPLPNLQKPWVGRLPYQIRRKASYLVAAGLERRLSASATKYSTSDFSFD